LDGANSVRNIDLLSGANEVTEFNLQIPAGWKKKEPLVISKNNIHGKPTWTAAQEIKFNPSAKYTGDHVGLRWFDSFDDLTEFLNWWHT
jgi:hypothetical protein